MQLLTIDFETFFSNDYSLSRKEYNTESYIRSPLFKAHGASIRWPNGSIEWWTGARLPALFAQIDWTQTAVLMHHACFDGLILSHHYGVRPAFFLDTLFMANLLYPRDSKSLGALAKRFNFSEKSVPYNLFRGLWDLPLDVERQLAEGCNHDIELTYAIFQKLLPLTPRGELEIIDTTIRFFTEPTLNIDVDRAEAAALRIAAHKESILDELGIDRDALASRECFAELLRELGVDPPMKISAATGEMTFGFAKSDSGMRDLLEHENEQIAALAAAKIGVSSTLGETRARRIADMGRRGKATIYIKHAGAHTGRPSAGDGTNFYNMPRDGELRGCLMAPPGYKLAIVDENAIECRLVNELAGNQRVTDAFARHEDVYANLASDIYRYPVNKNDQPSERFVGKVVELASGYGLSAKTLKVRLCTGAIGGTALPTTDDQAQLYTNTYRNTHQPVVAYWRQADWILDILLGKGQTDWGPMQVRDGFIFLPDGTSLDYSTIHTRTDKDGKLEKWVLRRQGATKIYGSKLVENVTQALAWLITKDAMRVLSKEMKLVLAPYDELVACVSDDRADAALARMVEVMSRVPPWAPGLPVEAEGHLSQRYSK